MMRTLFRALLALTLMAGVAWAGYNIRQDRDSASWVGPTDDFTVGQETFSIVFSFAAGAETAVIPMHFNGRLREVLASRNVTGNPAINTTQILQFWRLRAASRGDFALMSTWSIGDGPLARTATPAPRNFLHLSTTGPHNYPGYVVRTGQITALNTFVAGDSLAVTTTGTAAGTNSRATSATIIFIIDRTN